LGQLSHLSLDDEKRKKTQTGVVEKTWDGKETSKPRLRRVKLAKELRTDPSVVEAQEGGVEASKIEKSSTLQGD